MHFNPVETVPASASIVRSCLGALRSLKLRWAQATAIAARSRYFIEY